MSPSLFLQRPCYFRLDGFFVLFVLLAGAGFFFAAGFGLALAAASHCSTFLLSSSIFRFWSLRNCSSLALSCFSVSASCLAASRSVLALFAVTRLHMRRIVTRAASVRKISFNFWVSSLSVLSGLSIGPAMPPQVDF